MVHYVGYNYGCRDADDVVKGISSGGYFASNSLAVKEAPIDIIANAMY